MQNKECPEFHLMLREICEVVVRDRRIHLSAVTAVHK